MFAETPPLPALRLPLSDVASVSPDSKIIIAIGVKRAFLYGVAKRNLCIELPPQDELHAAGTHVGVLRRSMYGTRDAARVWQGEIEKQMKALQFTLSVLHPSLFRCERRGLLVIAHVDDFLSTGPEQELVWFREEVSKTFELKSDNFVPEEHHVQTIDFFNRRISRRSDGLEMEADSKQGPRLLNEWGMNQCKRSEVPCRTRAKRTRGHPSRRGRNDIPKK